MPRRKGNDEDSVSSIGDDHNDEVSVAYSAASQVESIGNSISTKGAPYAPDVKLAEKESRHVTWSKIVVLVVIAITASAASSTVHAYTKQVEESDFHSKYNDFAHEILVVSQLNAHHIFETYKGMSLQMTAYAAGTKSTWPFVSFPHYEAQASQAIEFTGANFVSFSPLVKREDRDEYQEYASTHREWLEQGLVYAGLPPQNFTIPYEIFGFDPTTGAEIPAPDADLYAPAAHISPIDDARERYINYDSFDFYYFRRVFDGMIEVDRAILSEVLNLEEFKADTPDGNIRAFSDDVDDIIHYDELETEDWPASLMAAPIYDRLGLDHSVVGVIIADMPWHSYFQHLIPEGIDGIYLVVRNTCGQQFTYVINGPNVVYLGPEDLHDPRWDDHEITTDFTVFKSIEQCRYSLHLFPSNELADAYRTDQPLINTIAVVIIFLVTTGVFILYDCFVERRQEKVMSSANRTNAIVNSLFPENVRDRLLVEVESAPSTKGVETPKNPLRVASFIGSAIRSFHEGNQPTVNPAFASKPIADLFPHATVLFGDIAGFTAWSSVRDPAQVFTLLETVYGAFDRIARKLGVFKVETIGDSYVAAAGLPESRPDHAVVMARFSRLCLGKLKDVVYQLDSRLGPGTAELTMRFGIHSGPVTAGVLRGEKSRFQLFGDTVNTASRMESTGMKDKIQLSQETAELLIALGKARWISPRDTKVVAKGKGELQTYWLSLRPATSSLSNTSTTDSMHMSGEVLEEELPSFQRPPEPITWSSRLIEWNIDNLEGILKKIIAMRYEKGEEMLYNSASIDGLDIRRNPDKTVLDELEEFIVLPDKVAMYKQDPAEVQLSNDAIEQLRDFVKAIESVHNDNPFHSFAHATHVGQSVGKLLSRVTTSDTMGSEGFWEENLHKSSHGIASDPLTQFACAFSAMIHDVDHPGVPNLQLVNEKTDLALRYKNKSVAEQNSVDVAWEVLMQPKYKDLRACIYTNQSELYRFRQLVVNAVMATDIVDKELFAMRRSRWEKAFNWQYGEETTVLDADREVSYRKATVIIEHLMQASDVAHTMQHWHVFAKWNEKLFQELYRAYKSGRGSSDPSVSWYEGELGFFDYYIIPLANKLKDCGVFGVASDEYLNYAEANRREWELKGKEIVRGYVEAYDEQATAKQPNDKKENAQNSA